MAENKIPKLLMGTLAFLDPVDEHARSLDTTDTQRGWLQQTDSWVSVESLTEDVMAEFSARADPPTPAGIVGITKHGPILMLEVLGPYPSISLGGSKSSHRRYRARTILSPVPVRELRSTRLTHLEASFPEIHRWAGIETIQETYSRDNDGKLTGFSFKEGPFNAISAKVTRGRSITIGTTWGVDGPGDRRTINAPVTLACSASRPKNLWDLLAPLLNLQDLLSIAHVGFVAADDGIGRLHINPTCDDDNKANLWNGALMVPSKGAIIPKSMTELPLFYLSTIGGVRGLSRWIRLTESHPRATRPVTTTFRNGLLTPYVALMEAAAGIEYWTGIHKRSSSWAKTGKNYPPPEALGNRVGRSFKTWVGGSLHAWADDFWSSYNAFKHDPKQAFDVQHLTDLALAGRYLLTAALLDRIAGTKAPSHHLFRSHHLYPLGDRLSHAYGQAL